eukprot:COSAG03_NODE_16855_length_390_cov_1.408935_1_plen_52_part_01
MSDRLTRKCAQLQVWRDDGLPEDVPMFITESDLAAGLDQMFVHVFSGLWLAD